MNRDRPKDRSDREAGASEPTEPIEGWLRYELQNLHKSVLDESLPEPLNELLARLENRLARGEHPQSRGPQAKRRRPGNPGDTHEEK